MFQSRDVLLNVVEGDGDGPPFVFQHGLGGDADQTAEVFPADCGRRLITLECRGHGRSDAGPEACFRLDQFCADLGAFIETLAAPVDIGGISMGACIALMLAVRRLELVRSLILARPAWLLDPAPSNLKPNVTVGKLLGRHEPKAALDLFNQSADAEELARSSPDNLASMRGFFARPNPQVLASLLTRISADGPGLEEDDLRRLAIPVLVIGTEQDHIHPFSLADKLATMIPGATVAKITPKGASREDYVREFKAAVGAFLAGKAQSAARSHRHCSE
jgi:pimeloyl-ACP methyl ester carboxylesterase